MSRLFAPLFPLVALLACAGGDPKPAGPDEGPPTSGTFSDCDPVQPTVCGFPFPSTFYMAEDTASPTGWRIQLGATTLPINANGYQPVPDFWNERDGWSVYTPAIAHFPGMSAAGLNGPDDIEASLGPSALTVLIDVETGERVPHFAERDISLEDSDNSSLLIHPVVPLGYGKRYVVGVRGLVDQSGAALEPTAAFRQLRSGSPSDTWDVEGRRPVYDEVIFPALESAGWARDEVLLAWDFVTGSQQGITGKAVAMRDDALARLPAEGPVYTVDAVEMAPNEFTAWRIKGTVTVPLYLTADAPGSVLTRGADGMPTVNGETTVPYTVVVPNSLVAERRPGAIVQYGHGLLGGQGEVHAEYLAQMADRYGWVVFAMDWTGMAATDVQAITLMLVNNIDQFAIIPERSHQGFVEFLYGMELVAGPLAQHESLTVQDPVSGDRISLVDPSRRYYYGNSQGAILGAAYTAVAPYFDRAVFGVGGGPYHLLLTRSKDFDPFFIIFQTMYPDPKHVALLLGMIQTLWDSAEGAGYAPSMVREPLPGKSPTRVLQQVAIGDAQVTTLGAAALGRAYDSVLIGEPVRPVWGMETVAGPHAGSALVEWDYGLEEPLVNRPRTDENDPHELPRRERAAQDQIDHFFTTGEVRDFCEGPCADFTRY